MSATIVQFENKFLSEVKEIFFESSTKKTFKDDAEKGLFFEKYLGHYLRNHPSLCLVAVSDRVLGYVVAAPDSEGEELNKLQPHLETFKKHFVKYPAHLHINCHFESRGLGVGGQLIKAVEALLRSQGISGLHIMTGPDSPNQSFYKKLGFDFQTELNFQGSSILFMGKSL